jgi:hypothetical protein
VPTLHQQHTIAEAQRSAKQLVLCVPQGFFLNSAFCSLLALDVDIGTGFGSGFWLRPAANMTCLALASDSIQDAACTGTVAIVLVLAECVMLVSSQQPLGQLPSIGRGTCSNTLFSSGIGPGPEGLALRPNNNTPQGQARRADWLSFGAESKKKLWCACLAAYPVC